MSTSRRFSTLFVSLCGLVPRSVLAAEHVSAHLDYGLPADAAGCPDEAAFRTKVAARLGYDPFTKGTGGQTVSVRFTEDTTSVRARMELRGSGGGEPAVRELVGVRGRCETLASALANTVALALDPIAAVAPHAAPPPSVALAPAAVPAVVATPPPAAAPQPAPVAATPRRPFHVYVVLGGDAALGLVPGPALGGHASIGLRYDPFSIEADGRVETSASAQGSNSTNRVGATVLAGGIRPCIHRAWLSACALFRAGVLQGRAPGVIDPALGSSFISAFGLGLLVELPTTSRVRARLEVDTMMPTVRTELKINDQVVWTASPVVGALSLAATADLL